MLKSVCLIGIGEMGGVFARGFLKLGHPVVPITRGMDLGPVAKEVPEPQAVIVAVSEKDLQPTLKAIPKAWIDRLVLLQNELLPRDWKAHGIANPTVISAWFEKKRPQDYKVIIPSPIYGPQADLVARALQAMDIPCKVLKSEEELVVELIVKNLYILTINIAGLKVGGTVEALWNNHQPLARDVANDVLDIQFWLAGKKFDKEKLIQKMVEAFAGDWQHKCLGRTAKERLERAIAQAKEAGLKAEALKKIAA